MQFLAKCVTTLQSYSKCLEIMKNWAIPAKNITLKLAFITAWEYWLDFVLTEFLK